MRFVFAFGALLATAAAQTPSLTEALTSASDLSKLTTIITGFPDLVAQLSDAKDITILAPSNAAIDKLANSGAAAVAALADPKVVQAILSYHVLNGTFKSSQITTTPTFVPTHLTNTAFSRVTGGQRVEAVSSGGKVQFISGLLTVSTVTKADIKFTGGIIHVIDTVLSPPTTVSKTAVELNVTSAAGALAKASLVSTVDSASDITIFVPNNEAFKSIGSLLDKISIETLASILSYHVVKGTVLYSPQVKNGTVTTLSGKDLTTTVTDSAIFINQARVVIPNVLVANGVVHVIDSVLNPDKASAAPGSGVSFGNASTVSNVPYTSLVGTPTGNITVPAQVTPTAATTSINSTGGAAGAGRALSTGIVGAGVLLAAVLLAL